MPDVDTTIPVPLETIPTRKLYTYRVVVEVNNNPDNKVLNYYVEAPTQCSANRYTAMREEVVAVVYIEQWTKPIPQPITFSTEKDCP